MFPKKNTTEEKPRKKKSSYRDIVEIVVAFAVAFLLYQGLILATGTKLPIVSVVSDSMYHTTPFGTWWENSGKFYEDSGINESRFLSFHDFNGLSKGDLLFVVKAENVSIGDIVIYQRDPASFTIVHRVVKIDGDTITVRGDNNPVSDPPFQKQDLQGKVVFAVPVLGYPRYILHLFGI